MALFDFGTVSVHKIFESYCVKPIFVIISCKAYKNGHKKRKRGAALEQLNYETFYQNEKPLEKKLGEKLQQAQKSFRGIVRDLAGGDLRQLARDIEDLLGHAAELSVLTENLKAATEGFDSKGYFESGEFTRQLIEACEKAGVDIKGEAGVYEMFPFKLRVDTENQDLYVNRRKFHCVRPEKFAEDMKTRVEKYTKQSFNMSLFINELAAAYDTAVKIKNYESSAPRREPDIHLVDIYKYLAPTQKARREYSMQHYAYELSRLYSQGMEEQTKDERRFVFGTTRNSNKMIRILDINGAEEFLSTVRFYTSEDSE